MLRTFLLVLLLSFVGPFSWAAPTAQDYYQAGVQLYNSGKLEDALKYFQASLQTAPDYWQSYQMAGYVYFKRGAKNLAIQTWNRSLGIHPDNPALREFMGTLGMGTVDAASTSVTDRSPSSYSHPGSKIPKEKWSVKYSFVFASINYPEWIKIWDSNTWEPIDVPVPRNTTFGNGLGVGYLMGRTGHLGFQPELWYLQKGGTGSIRDQYQEQIRLHYLEMPLLVKLFFSKSKRSNFYAGPYFAYKLGQSRTLTGDVPKIVVDLDLWSGLKSFDYGLDVGFEFSFFKHLIIEFTADVGYASLVGGGVNCNNSAFRSACGWRF